VLQPRHETMQTRSAASEERAANRWPSRANGKRGQPGASIKGAGAPSAGRESAAIVVPFARALAVLGAYGPHDRWLGNHELASRTGLPQSTITRIAQSLVALRYLHYAHAERKYRLAASVLALGYGAIANSDVQRAARAHMQAFAQRHQVLVNLSSRDRLELIVLESCSGLKAALPPGLHVGARVGLASSPMGWALLAGLPELERFYLMGNLERKMPREWPRLRRRSGEAIAQVLEKGFCVSLGEADNELGVVAAPLLIADHAPLVLACFGSGAEASPQRLRRELGPQLLALASDIQQAGVIE
jgi:DNA-binding IclR family transcriptional regulator